MPIPRGVSLQRVAPVLAGIGDIRHSRARTIRRYPCRPMAASAAPTGRRRARPGWLATVAVALGASVFILVVDGIVHPAGEPSASTAIPSFPSVVAIPPGATPGVAATIPLVRPRFPYVGREPWQIAHESTPTRVIEGYASAPSYLPGQTLRLAVDCSGATFGVSIFRVSGNAPAASPFELMAQIPSQAGHRQPAPVVDPVTKMVAARWAFSVAFPIPVSWPSGVYLARLDSNEGVQSYVPFVVRSPSPARFLVVSNALTWQAYNSWGGSDLYGSALGEPLPGVTRALAVSFDRPYVTDGGAGQLFFLELPMIAWLERQHLDVAFATDYDLSVNPEAQPLPSAVIFIGHSEYWGVPLRLWLEDHVLRTGDVSLGVFAADSGYWPVVLTGAGPDGPRVATCYKDGPLPEPSASGSPGPVEPSASELPSAAPMDEEKTPSSLSVGTFPPSGPYLGPYVGSFDVQALMGVTYQHITTTMASYTLANPMPAPSLLDGTGIQPGAPIGFVAGGEVDAIDQGGTASPATAGTEGGVLAAAYGIPSNHGAVSSAEAVYRTLASGARVFASGTFYWGWALDPAFAAQHDVVAGFERLTFNILAGLGG